MLKAQASLMTASQKICCSYQ